MAATTTLSSTTLMAPAEVGDTAVCVASTTGITPGLQLFVDQELMSVVSVGLASLGGTLVNVLRGRGATGTQRHSNGATVWLAQGYQTYSQDPIGAPGEIVEVTPYINTQNGTMWIPQGDDAPSLSGNNTSPSVRWWQQVTPTHGITSLGVRTSSTDPLVSNSN